MFWSMFSCNLYKTSNVFKLWSTQLWIVCYILWRSWLSNILLGCTCSILLYDAVVCLTLCLPILFEGYMTTGEVKQYEKVQCQYNKFWVPLVWANTVLTEAKGEGKIESDIGFRLLLEVSEIIQNTITTCHKKVTSMEAFVRVGKHHISSI